jgi:hypothetical protein
MSIQQNFPAITPSLSLNFARSKKLDPRITFTRTSSATRTNETGLVEVVPANSPRFDHSYDPVSGSVRSLGLLVEEQRVNYALNSSTPSLWTIPNMIQTGNSVILPDGTTSTGVEYRGETEDANLKLLRPLPSGSGIVAGDTWTFSVFLRAGSEDTCHLALLDRFNSGSTGRTFDMVNGVFTGPQGFGGTVSQGSSGVEKYPNGWWRVWINAVFTINEPDGHQIYLRLWANSGSVPFTTSFSAWGAQLEKGSFPTSYIPTTTSTVTRTADNASITGSNFSDWFNPTEGTTVIQIQNYNISNTSTSLFSYSGTTFPNNSMNYFRQLDAQPVGQIIFNGTLPMNIGLGAVWTDSSLQKHAFFYQKDNSGIANRSLVSLDTSVDIPVVERITIGSASTLQTNNKFTLSQLTYYPRRLSNAQLQTLTR